MVLAQREAQTTRLKNKKLLILISHEMNSFMYIHMDS